jgi:hypothetical protein
MQHVTTIKVPFALDEMRDSAENIFDESLESICDRLQVADISPQCFSAKFIDENNEPILFYFGFRHPEAKHRHGYGVGLIFIFKFQFHTNNL